MPASGPATPPVTRPPVARTSNNPSTVLPPTGSENTRSVTNAQPRYKPMGAHSDLLNCHAQTSASPDTIVLRPTIASVPVSLISRQAMVRYSPYSAAGSKQDKAKGRYDK